MFEGADFKYDNSFLKLLPKNPQRRHFWSQIQAFLFHSKNLQLNNFEGADIKYEFQLQNTQIWHFQSQIQAFSLFHENWQLGKFEGVDFKYNNIFSTFSLKIPKSGSFGSKFRDFYFAPNFALIQIRGRWFQICQWLFQIPA